MNASRRIAIPMICAVLTLSLGCASSRVVTGHEKLRDVLVDLQETQIQDNLVRIKAGKAFLHVNYSSIKGKSFDEVSGYFRGGDDDREVLGDNNVVIETDAFSLPVYEAAGKFNDEFAVDAVPVLGNRTVYDSYIIFAEEFMKDMTKSPPTGATLWQRETKDGDAVLYVPDTHMARKAYERIVLLTTLDQGKNRRVALAEVTAAQEGEDVVLKLVPELSVQTGVLLWSAGDDSVRPIEFTREVKSDGATIVARTIEQTKSTESKSQGDGGASRTILDSTVTTMKEDAKDTATYHLVAHSSGCHSKPTDLVEAISKITGFRLPCGVNSVADGDPGRRGGTGSRS